MTSQRRKTIKKKYLAHRFGRKTEKRKPFVQASTKEKRQLREFGVRPAKKISARPTPQAVEKQVEKIKAQLGITPAQQASIEDRAEKMRAILSGEIQIKPARKPAAKKVEKITVKSTRLTEKAGVKLANKKPAAKVTGTKKTARIKAK